MGVLVDVDLDVKPHLNIDADQIQDDVELEGFVDACEIVIQDITGPVAPQSYDEFYDGGHPTIVVRNRPIQSLTAVTEFLGPVAFQLAIVTNAHLSTPYSVTWEPNGRIVRRLTGGVTTPFAVGLGTVEVSYTAGLAAVPANVRLATLELVRHNWQLTQQGGRPAFGGMGADEDAVMVSSGFAVPARVIELLEPNKRPPAIG